MISNKRGFTAAEIITVVAIIAILALIVIPKFWKRTEEARISRAKEEMARIADAEGLCFAYTGYYVHLGNLHGTEPGNTYTIVTAWDFQSWVNAGGPIIPQVGSGYSVISVKNWTGPYITYQPSEMVDETSFSPLDPWKNPYLFYGPVTVNSKDSTESSKIYFWSRGPNLLFDGTIPYLPWGQTTGPITAGDDIVYIR